MKYLLALFSVAATATPALAHANAQVHAHGSEIAVLVGMAAICLAVVLRTLR